MLGVSYLLGEQHRERVTGEPYESGIAPTVFERTRFPVHFYLVALSFLIFDLEAAFIFGWAVAAKELGWSGYAGVSFFIIVLGVMLAYEWKTGALAWGPTPRRARSGTEILLPDAATGVNNG